MNRMVARTVALAFAMSPVLVGASECGTDSPTPPTENETTDCLVYGQQTNSKRQHYLEIKCSESGGGLSEFSELLPNNDPNAWPACGNGANWPACKEG